MKTPHKLSFILILLVQAVVLNACIVPATPQAAADVASPGLEETATSAAVSEAGACETGFRLFDHELLATDPICIPSHPQRIAFIDSVIAYAIALEVESVTKNYYFDAFLGDFPTLVDEATINKMADVGNTWELNPESLALAKPDLIVSATWWSEVNAQIQTIAPTVILNGEYWVRDHPISAHRILDDLFRYVAKVDPAEVAPNPFAYTYPQPAPSQ